MRCRLFKRTNRQNERFAWLPKRMSNGTIIWLEPYRRERRGRTYRGKDEGSSPAAASGAAENAGGTDHG